MTHMQQPMQPIIQHLFQTASLEEVSRERLESFVEEYPSFGIGHYLLSHKLQSEDPGAFQEATQKTCLYFSNPFWLQWLLGNSSTNNGQEERADTLAAGIPAEAILAGEPAMDTLPSETIPYEEAPVYSGSPETAHPEEPTADAMPAEVTLAEESLLDMNAAKTPPLDEASVADQLLRRIEEARGLRETLQKINDDFMTGVPHGNEEPIRDEETPFVLEESEETPEQAGARQEPTPPAPTPKQEPEPGGTASTLVFEPYHTIDYFASQGIKLTLEENPGDSLGKQLKSFTDWLKVMRRLPQKDRESVPDRVAEQAIQAFAAHSIESKDVVTETMAEVLARQGMRDRARAVYEKLSLLNPDKRAYFAIKIEQLNIP